MPAELPDGFAAALGGESRLSIALLEPGGGWSAASTRATVESNRLTGTKAAVEHAADADHFAVVARVDGEPGLAIVGSGSPGIDLTPQSSFDVTVPLSRVTFADAEVEAVAIASSPKRSSTVSPASGASSPPPRPSARRPGYSSKRGATPPSAGSSVGRSDATRLCAT